MAQKILNTGTNANKGDGDTLRVAMEKVNDNFTELFLSPLSGGDFTFIGNEIAATRSNDDIVLKPSGTGSVSMPALRFNDNNIEGIRSNEDINLIPAGTGAVVFSSIKINGTTLSSDDSAAINVNENLLIDGALNVSGTTTIDGAVSVGSTVDVPSGLTSLSTLNVTGATSLTGTTTIDNLTLNDNIISSTSNADIRLEPGGTGSVIISELTVDNNINITDNEIKTTQSNSDLVLTASGTGAVFIDNADINGGEIDNTTIGANTPAAGTFTTVTANTSVIIDGVTVADNMIYTNSSNSDLELSASGTGGVIISGFTFPTTDGSPGQFIRTDGAGTLSFATLTSPSTLNHSDIIDTTTTVTSSATEVIDTWNTSAYRSAKYFISVSDDAMGRYEIVEANITHGPSADSSTEAYISSFGSVTNYISPVTTLSVDVVNGAVRLKATNVSDNPTVFKIQRITIDN